MKRYRSGPYGGMIEDDKGPYIRVDDLSNESEIEAALTEYIEQNRVVYWNNPPWARSLIHQAFKAGCDAILKLKVSMLKITFSPEQRAEANRYLGDPNGATVAEQQATAVLNDQVTTMTTVLEAVSNQPDEPESQKLIGILKKLVG